MHILFLNLSKIVILLWLAIVKLSAVLLPVGFGSVMFTHTGKDIIICGIFRVLE